MGKILLFYKYIHIEFPKRILKWQQKICADLGLHGRIILAHEGINGTVGGESEQIKRYKALMAKHELFKYIDFKESDGDASFFPRMEIKVKPEIVHMGIDSEKVKAQQGGIHLTPEQVHDLLSSKPQDLVILDARNNFESKIGKFVDAITPDLENFRDFPTYIDENENQFKDKQVLMYCTGGVRCERLTAYLKQKNISKEVFQINGGIVRYCEKYPNGFFRGKNYVFDRRVAVRINDDVLASCSQCNTPCDEYTNCLNAECNEHFIACKNCFEKYGNACSQRCHDLIKNHKVKTRVPFAKVTCKVAP